MQEQFTPRSDSAAPLPPIDFTKRLIIVVLVDALIARVGPRLWGRDLDDVIAAFQEEWNANGAAFSLILDADLPIIRRRFASVMQRRTVTA